jgi:S-adenosylmethionine decarboxylase
MGMKPLGRHLLLELFECDATALSSLTTVKTSMLEAATRAHATIVNHVFHEFSPFGVSGVVVIAESHLAIHTWPEYRFAAVDVFSCGEVLQPQLAAEYLAERFTAGRVSVVELGRGVLGHEVAEKNHALPSSRRRRKQPAAGRRPSATFRPGSDRPDPRVPRGSSPAA